MNPKNPRDRKTLKNFFSDGARPTAQHYADLIDSGVCFWGPRAAP